MTLAFETKTIFCIVICIHFQLILASHYVKHLVPKKKNTTSLRVYNGKPAQLGEIPYQVAFKSRVNDIYVTFCGGSIIGQSKLLSAAHCFVSDETATSAKTICGFNRPVSLRNKYAVAATTRNHEYGWQLDGFSQWRSLLNVTYPEDYNFPVNDIAILFVKNPFKFNEFVKPINLAKKFIDYSGTCMVSGYGRISYDILSDSLMKANLQLLPQRWCNSVHNRDMSKFVCTSLIETDIGNGDSGGPLVCANTGDPMEKDGSGVLVGIASGTYEHLNVSQHVKQNVTYVHINGSSFRAYNFSRARLGEIPYQVALMNKDEKYYVTFCGGSIIGESRILTAAHCFIDSYIIRTKDGLRKRRDFADKYAVAATLTTKHFGDEIEKFAQRRSLYSFAYFSNYSFPDHDIIVLIVTSPFTFNKYVKPINIATKFVDYSGYCLLSRYGRPRDASSAVLLKAYLRIFSNRWCSEGRETDMSYYICTSLVEADFDEGDSGGPLVCANTGDPMEKDNRGVLVGIAGVSYAGDHSIFTRVSNYYDIIQGGKLKKRYAISGAIVYFISSIMITLNYVCVVIIS